MPPKRKIYRTLDFANKRSRLDENSECQNEIDKKRSKNRRFTKQQGSSRGQIRQQQQQKQPLNMSRKGEAQSRKPRQETRKIIQSRAGQMSPRKEQAVSRCIQDVEIKCDPEEIICLDNGDGDIKTAPQFISGLEGVRDYLLVSLETVPRKKRSRN